MMKAPETDGKKRALFFVYQRTVFVDAYRTALQLKAKTEYKPVFLVAAGTRELVREDIERCRRDGIACFTEEELVIAPPPAVAQFQHFARLRAFGYRCCQFAKYRSLWLLMKGWRAVAYFIPRPTILSGAQWVAKRLAAHIESGRQLPNLVERALGISIEISRLRAVEARYGDALKTLKPAILCLSEDMPGPITGPLIKAARLLGVPSVILPFTIPNAREAIEAVYATVQNDLWITDYLANELATNLYPRWSITYKDRVLLRTHGRFVIAAERLGIAPPDPWVANSGLADRIAVESEQMLTTYRNLDFPARQLAMTGSAADDMLFDASREREASRRSLYAELGLQNDLPLLLTSLVPDQMNSGVPACEFDRYDVMLEFWVSTLAKWGHRYNVLLKVNPRTPWQDFVYLERLGAKVAPMDTIRLIPFAKIYVASISSTLRWATACGIPSINYDVYHYRYGDYLAASGIEHVEKKQDFIAAVDRLAGDEAHWNMMRQRQLAQAASWGRMDGASTSRLAALFDELLASKNSLTAGTSVR